MTGDEKRSVNGTLVVGIILGALILVITAGALGYFAGLAAAVPDTITEVLTETVRETITEQVEVTREVVREVEVPVIVNEEETVSEKSEFSPDEASVEQTGELVIEGNPQDIEFDVFYETWRLIESQFDGEVPQNNDVLYSAIEGSLETLDDDFTRFLRPDLAARIREDAGGSVEGIGAIVIENDAEQFEIVRPIAGQAAEKAGLLPGDIILAVDGESLENYSFNEAILKVRGPRGTDVTLTVLRDGEDPFDLTITRVRFELVTLESEMLADDIAYIKLNEFNQSAAEQTTAALDELLAQNPRGLIFDLRDNPGGLLTQSIAVADIFLPESVVLFERNRNGLDQTFSADEGDIGEEIELVVLINPGSASASEIVAGAIQDHERGVLLGETTFGKGSVQQVHELSDGSELRVTIARWYTPDNNSIDNEGVNPDIEVPMEFGAEEDVQLEEAIQYILENE